MNYISDTMRHAGLGLMADHLAQRDANGEPEKVILRPPGGAGPIELDQCRVEPLSHSLVEDANGHIVKRETTTLHIPRPVNELELRLLQRSEFVIPAYGDRTWIPQPDGATASHTYLTYKLERMPLARLDEKRDGPLQ